MSDDQHEASSAPATAAVTRAVEVEADAGEVWAAVSDPELRSLWLDDDDARARHVRLDEVEDGRRLRWTWWRPDDELGASSVEIVLAPSPTGTRVVVTETLPAPARITASVAAGSSGVSLSAGVGHRWSYRLLGLELLLVAAGALVR